MGEWNSFKTENIRIELFLKEEKQLGKGVTRHFAFLVEDCDEMINRIKQEGYSILMEPKRCLYRKRLFCSCGILYRSHWRKN